MSSGGRFPKGTLSLQKFTRTFGFLGLSKGSLLGLSKGQFSDKITHTRVEGVGRAAVLAAGFGFGLWALARCLGVVVTGPSF